MDSLNQMFDRQISTLLEQGYPRLTGMSERTLLGHCERLRRRLRSVSFGPLDLVAGRIPFVLVVSGRRLEAAAAIAGRGVAMLTPAFYSDDVAAGRLVQPFPQVGWDGHGYYLAYPESRRNSPKIKAFRDWLLPATEALRSRQSA